MQNYGGQMVRIGDEEGRHWEKYSVTQLLAAQPPSEAEAERDEETEQRSRDWSTKFHQKYCQELITFK